MAEQADTPHQVFERYLDAITTQRWDELPALYAHDAVVEHPFGPPDHRFLHGRDELRAHFTALHDMSLKMQASDVLVHDTRDPRWSSPSSLTTARQARASPSGVATSS